MDKISVKNADLALRASDNVKSAGKKTEAADDFKKLLKGQQEDSQEVSGDTKAEKKPETAKDSKEVSGDDSGKAQKEDNAEVKEEKNTTAEGLLAAYQMFQNMRPEVIQAPAEEEAVSEILPEVTEELIVQTAEEVQMPEIPVQAEAVQTEEKVPETIQPKLQAEEPAETEKAEPLAEAVPVQKKSEETGKENAQDTDSRGADHAMQMQAPVEKPSVQAEVQETKLQEPVRMQVPEPEKLPEKVTEQIMAKMSEGVREFEIHIEPANLGKIAIKILYQEGQATVSVMCSEKRTFEMMGRSAGELGQVIEKNLGGTTTIIVDKQESDYLNQARDENQKNGRNDEQGEKKENSKNHDAEDAEQFLQKLRLGLADQK